MDWDMIPPFHLMRVFQTLVCTMFIPPRIVSTALLPVLMVSTRLRLSETSRPVAKEEPWSSLQHMQKVKTSRCRTITLMTASCMRMFANVNRSISKQKWPPTLIFSTFASLRPLILSSWRRGVMLTPDTVFKAADLQNFNFSLKDKS